MSLLNFHSHGPTSQVAEVPAVVVEEKENVSLKKSMDDLWSGSSYLSTPCEGFFAVLMDELRKEVFKFIAVDGDFARAARVNRRWNKEITTFWYQFAEKRGDFVELDFWKNQGKAWKWVIRSKITIIDLKDRDKFTGIGACQETNGLFEGEFKEGRKCGWGKKIYTADKSYYIGCWDNSRKNGFGIYVWADGTRYEGFWKDDKYHGKGIKKWQNKDEYDGEWKEDKKHGTGKYRWGTGDEYYGEWEDDIQSGKGVMRWSSGDRYEGGFKNNMFEGIGTYYYEVGDKYVGEWKGNDRCGKAIYYYRYGGVFEGMFREDERNGEGVFTWPDKDEYQGVWKDGSRFGKGFFISFTSSIPQEQNWTTLDENPHANYSTGVPRKWPTSTAPNSFAN